MAPKAQLAMNEEEEKYLEFQLRTSNNLRKAASRRSTGIRSKSKYHISKQQQRPKQPLNSSIVKKTLVDLPEEILDKLCLALRESEDSFALSALRKTCKLFGRVAEEHLFHTIPVDLNGRNLYKAMAITKHPQFSKLVQKVVVECEPALRSMTIHEWVDNVNSYGNSPLASLRDHGSHWGQALYQAGLLEQKSKIKSEAELLEHWQIYRYCLKEQNRIKSVGATLIDQFVSFFSGLPNLESLHLRAQTTSKYAVTGHNSRIRAIHRDTLTMPPFEPMDDGSGFPVKYIMVLLRGLRQSRSRLRTICMEGLPCSTFAPVAMMDTNERPALPELNSIHVLMESYSQSWNSGTAAENLLRFIDAEVHPTLRVLELQQRILQPGSQSIAKSTAFPLNVELVDWPQLQVVHLGNAYAHRDTWKNIIFQLGPSLCKLTLSDCEIEHGYWVDTLQYLRDNTLVLEELELRGESKELVDGQADRAWELSKGQPLRSLWLRQTHIRESLLHRYEAYLLRHTDEAPLLAWEKGGCEYAWIVSSDSSMRYKYLRGWP